MPPYLKQILPAIMLLFAVTSLHAGVTTNNVPPTQVTLPLAPVTFSSANGNLISVGYATMNTVISVELAGGSGGILLSNTTGLTLQDGNNGSGLMNYTGTVTAINAALSDLTYYPPGNGTSGFIIISTYDSTNTLDQDVISILVNNPPTFTGGETLPPVDEDTVNPPGQTITALLGAEFVDVNSNGFAGIAVVMDASDSATEGDWEYSTDAGGTWFDIGTVSTATGLLLAPSAKLRFVPLAGFTGTPGVLTVHAVDDSVATTFTNGGTRSVFNTITDAVSSQVAEAGVTLSTSISVIGVNDAPLGHSKAIATNESTAYTFSAADFGFSDVDVGDTLSAVRVDSVPLAGSLTLSGVAVTAAQVIVPADIPNLVFTPAANANGARYASFTFSVRDQSSVYDPTPNTLTVNVTPVYATITSVTVPANGTYIGGAAMNFTVNFNEAITVTGTPSLRLTLGSSSVSAAYVSGSGTSALTFRYTVTSNILDTNGFPVTTLSTGGGTLKDVAGDNATLTINNVGSTLGVLVNGGLPGVVSVAVPANATYVIGSNLNFIVRFSENITVNTGSGTPQLALTLDTGGTVYAGYVSGSGTAFLTFRYTAAAGDLDATGVVVGALSANGGTIRDASANNATLTLNNIASTTGVVIEAVAPRISSITRLTPSTSPTGADALVFRVGFSEPVANVNAADFSVSGTTATVTNVGSSASDVYDVTVSGGDLAALNGTVTVSFAVGQNIADLVGNALTNLTTTGTNDNSYVVANNITPAFNGGATQTLTVNEDGSAASLAALLEVVDADSGQTLTWSVTTAPTRGTLGGFPLTVSTAGNVTAIAPTGLTYAPSLNQNGADSFVIQVGDGTATASVTVNVTITAVNDAPVVTTSGGTTLFVEGSNVTSVPVIVDPALTVADVDSVTFASATVSITTHFQNGQDVLSFTNDSATMGNISGAYVSSTGVLTLTSSGATATIAEWRAALNAVVYSNSSDSPNESTRTITVIVNDGTDASAAATKQVSVTAANDAPTNIALSSSALNQSGGTNATVGILSTTDVDDTTFTYALVSGTGGADNASFNISGVTLRANNAATLTPGNKSVRVRTTDTGALTYEATFTITVLDNVPPTITSVAGPADGVYGIGGNLDFTATFSELVNVTGTPVLNITLQSGARSATYLSGTGTTTLVFRYVVQAGDYAAVGDVIIGTLALSAGTIQDVNANDALLALSAPTLPNVTVVKASALITFSGLEPIYDGAAKPVGVTTTPVGLAFTTTYDGSSTAPSAAGSYVVNTVVVDSIYAASASGTLVIGQATQTVAFTPVDSVVPGQSVTLVASATSTLPVTFSLISGSATLSGSTLSITGAGPIVVRATQAGNINYLPASTDGPINSSMIPQTIAFAQPDNHLATDGTFNLTATASSGLPVTLTLISGPALLSGSTVTLSGAAGTVMIRASQTGDTQYGAATNVTRSFDVAAQGARVFFGGFFSTAAASVRPAKTSGIHALGGQTLAIARVGEIAAVIPAHTNKGSLLIVAPDVGINALVAFMLNDDGSFSAPITQQTGASVAATRALTIGGQLTGNILSGTIDEAGFSFSIAVESPSGPSVDSAGLYRSTALDSAQGSTFTIVGSNNNVLVLAITPTLTIGGTATLQSNGTFTLQVPASSGGGNVTIQGTLDTAATTVSGSITAPNQAPIGYAGLVEGTVRTDRLVNLSSRARVGTGDKVLIVGFVIGGAQDKPLLFRAVGSGLSPYGVQGTLANPTLKLFRGSTLIASNDDWNSNVNATEIAAAASRLGAVPLTAGSTDSALMMTLPPGVYSAHVSGGAGVALAEIYDASENPGADYQRLVNISSRGEVTSGENTLIGGFVVTGNSPKKMLIRGVGPTLAAAGVSGSLADPVLKVFAEGSEIATNNDWGTDADAAAKISDAITITGAAPFANGSKDAALVLTLAPGLYSVHVTGNNDSTGIALVEIFELPE